MLVQPMLLQQIADMWQIYYASLQHSVVQNAYSKPAIAFFMSYSRSATLQQEWERLDSLTGDAFREQAAALAALMLHDQHFRDTICAKACQETGTDAPLRRLLDQVIVAVDEKLARLLLSTLGESYLFEQVTQSQHGSEYHARFANAMASSTQRMQERDNFIPALLADDHF